MIFYTFLVAALLVTGQSLWKLAATSTNKAEAFSLVPFFRDVILTPKFIIGAILYAIATLAYVWLFSKFAYSSVQLSLISFSIILSTGVAILLFRENFTLLNFFGVLMILAGVVLVVLKR